MIKCHLNISPSKECYEVCVQSRRCGALKMWERMAIETLRDDDCREGILTPEERSEVLNAIDDALHGYQVDGYEDTDGMFFKVLISKAESCSEKPNRSEPLTDKEQRIFLAAMGREEKVCKEVDEECRNCREPYEDNLVRVCHEIIRKVKAALWET